MTRKATSIDQARRMIEKLAWDESLVVATQGEVSFHFVDQLPHLMVYVDKKFNRVGLAKSTWNIISATGLSQVAFMDDMCAASDGVKILDPEDERYAPAVRAVHVQSRSSLASLVDDTTRLIHRIASVNEAGGSDDDKQMLAAEYANLFGVITSLRSELDICATSLELAGAALLA